MLETIFFNDDGCFCSSGKRLPVGTYNLERDGFNQLVNSPCVVSIQPSYIRVITNKINWPLVALIKNDEELCITTDPKEYLKKVSKNVDYTDLFQNVFINGSISGGTGIRTSKILLPGSIYDIELKENKVTRQETSHSNLSFSCSNKNISNLDTLVDDYLNFNEIYFQKIKDTGRKVYLGISGGLDSRIALSLAKKHNLDVDCFFIGTSIGRFGFHTQDYLSAMAIAEYFSLDLKIIDFSSASIKDRLLFEVSNLPFVSSELGRLVENYDFFTHGGILLNGGWGFWVQKPKFLRISPKEFLLEKSYLYERPNGYYLRQFLNQFLGFSLKLRKTPSYLSELGENELNKICQFLFEFKDHNELIDYWSYNVSGSRISSGIFESMGNLLEPVSIYNEFFALNPSLDNQVDWHHNRIFLKKVLSNLEPELLDIPGQGGRIFNNSFSSRIRTVLRQLIAGHGVMNYKRDFKDSDKFHLLNIINSGLPEVSRYIDLDYLYDLTTKGKASPAVLSNLLKLSVLVIYND